MPAAAELGEIGPIQAQLMTTFEQKCQSDQADGPEKGTHYGFGCGNRRPGVRSNYEENT